MESYHVLNQSNGFYELINHSRPTKQLELANSASQMTPSAAESEDFDEFAAPKSALNKYLNHAEK